MKKFWKNCKEPIEDIVFCISHIGAIAILDLQVIKVLREEFKGNSPEVVS